MPQTLNKYAKAGDPLADELIAELAQQGLLQGNLQQQIATLIAADIPVARHWQEQTQTVPDWVDWQQIDQGRLLFLQHVPMAIVSFVLGTLLQVYAPPGSARVLIHTGRLRQDVLRRLYETATMVNAVLSPQGMRVGGKGHQAVLQVRLLHARVRFHVLNSGRWPVDTLGQPINQLQMALTALGFSLQIVDGLRRLGVPVSEEQAQAYQHLWRYANWLQGVDADLQCDSLAAEATLYQQLAPLLLQPDENSRILSHSMHQHLGGQAPFFLPSSGLQAISRYLLDTQLADAYQLPRHAGWQAALRVLHGLNRITGWRLVLPGLGRLEAQLGAAFFERLIAWGLASQPVDYGFKSAN